MQYEGRPNDGFDEQAIPPDVRPEGEGSKLSLEEEKASLERQIKDLEQKFDQEINPDWEQVKILRRKKDIVEDQINKKIM